MTSDPWPEAPSYRKYTTKFDRTVTAAELDSVLGPLSRKDQNLLEEAWNELQSGLLPWKTKLQIESTAFAAQIRAKMPVDQRECVVVSLLFDQSGSMRGQKMLFSAATADVTQEFLGTLQIACEVLGFTTSQWKGGRSRRRWKWRFKPRNPGRLNDLLHVVFRASDDNRVSSGAWVYRQMLRPDFPKENIDGEAIEWAASRLRNVDRSRKILIVLSDGAPVDDSTLLENGNRYLSDHLEHVVEQLKREGDIEIAAFGIGFAAHKFYPATHSVDNPEILGMELLHFITSLLLKDSDVGEN
jgi:cobaltochelatase CobT